jgi:hypothetical protein
MCQHNELILVVGAGVAQKQDNNASANVKRGLCDVDDSKSDTNLGEMMINDG